MWVAAGHIDLSLTTRSLVSLLFCPISLSLYLLCSEQLLEFLSETGSQKKQRYFHQKYIGVISRKVLWQFEPALPLSLSLFPSRRLVVERHTALWAHALAEDVHCWYVQSLFVVRIHSHRGSWRTPCCQPLTQLVGSPSTGCCMGFLVGRSHGASALRFCSTSLALCDQTRINLC